MAQEVRTGAGFVLDAEIIVDEKGKPFQVNQHIYFFLIYLSDPSYLFIYQSAFPPIYLSICLSIYLSIYIFPSILPSQLNLSKYKLSFAMHSLLYLR